MMVGSIMKSARANIKNRCSIVCNNRELQSHLLGTSSLGFTLMRYLIYKLSHTAGPEGQCRTRKKGGEIGTGRKGENGENTANEE